MNLCGSRGEHPGGEYAGLYCTRHDTPAHQALMNDAERYFAAALCAISTEAYEAFIHSPSERPCASLWGRAKDAFGRMCGELATDRQRPPSVPPIRRAVLSLLREQCMPDPQSHLELSERLILMAYWCCLGHAGLPTIGLSPDNKCIRAELYDRPGGICHRLFDAYLGCGSLGVPRTYERS
nr:virion protein US10 [Human alphaherpesvirus 3]WKR23551.1 virion protein US10 [Human alphaherpesvirus 3]WKR23619.1 virion protein US10 [Human alphaherpesvirus 3]WKR23624.1 virion protein US10 [Human alphaherpesvirus 3]